MTANAEHAESYDPQSLDAVKLGALHLMQSGCSC